SGDAGGASEATQKLVSELAAGFRAAMDDDLNASNALAALFHFVTEANKLSAQGPDAAALVAALDDIDRVLNVLSKESRHGFLSKEELASQSAGDGQAALAALQSRADSASVRDALLARAAARAAKDWGLADGIRDALKAAGVEVEDTPAGVRFTLPG
ncbi:MAG: cysteine--tRNA ligase, partial [Planctomycetes bacterium]|nr:cysteine--tRNA ligase [Planctomycetota bacterium]